MIKHIIREVAPEACDFSTYFDGDTFTEASGDYCNTLFIISNEGWGRLEGYNIDEYKRVRDQAEEIMEGFTDVNDGATDYDGRRITYKAIMEDAGIAYNAHKCHSLRQWHAQHDETDPEAIAEYLTITTGKRWTTSSARGYCQGDYVEMVYCPERYPEGVEECGEIWLGAAKEFCVIDINDDGTEGDTVYGYIVADCKAWRDAEYKDIICKWEGLEPDETRLEMIDSTTTRTIYSYRTA